MFIGKSLVLTIALTILY